MFSYFRSSTSWRVRIVLNYKKLNYDFKFIHLVKNQQNSEDYLKINPNGVTFFTYLFRQFQPLFYQQAKSLSSQWQYASFLMKNTLIFLSFLMMPSQKLKLEDSVKSSTQEFTPIKTSDFLKLLVRNLMLIKWNLPKNGLWKVCKLSKKCYKNQKESSVSEITLL